MNVAMRIADTRMAVPIAQEIEGIVSAGWHHGESFRALVDRVAKIPNISSGADKIGVINFIGDAFLNQFRLAATYERLMLCSFVRDFMSSGDVGFSFFIRPHFLQILRQGENWRQTLRPIGDAAAPKRCLVSITSLANPRMPYGAIAYPEGSVPEIYRDGSLGIR